MDLTHLMPDHWLVVPVAVFGFLSCIWLFVLATCSSSSDSDATRNSDRLVKTVIDGEEREIFLPPATSMGVRRTALARLLTDAGVNVSPRAFITQAAMLVGFTFVLALLWSRSLVIAVAVLAVLAAIVMAFLRIRAARRRDVLERQCVECLRLASRSIRAGHPISGVMQLLAERVPAPTGDLFVQIVQREKMGESLSSALRTVLMKAENKELRAFGTAILVQMEVGGSLTQTIDRLCASIIERMALRKRGRALTADARLSAQLVLILPFICVTVFSTFSERYSDFIFGDPLGRLFLVGALMLLLGGILGVNRLSRIDRQYEGAAQS